VPTYFEIVCQTLDIGYEDIESANRDSKIKERLEKLTTTYGNVLVTGGPSYEDNVTPFCICVQVRDGSCGLSQQHYSVVARATRGIALLPWTARLQLVRMRHYRISSVDPSCTRGHTPSCSVRRLQWSSG